jgi:AcrR family transcriptional regulator
MTLERKEKEKEQRRNTIIDAAQALFFAKPYDEITIEAIAERAQLAKGTVYLYFTSKEEVYSAVAVRGARILNQLLKDKIEGKKNGLEKTFATGEAYYQFFNEQPRYFKMFSEAANLDLCDYKTSQELFTVSRDNLEIVLNAVIEGERDDSIKPDLDPKLTAIFLIQSTKSMIELTPGFEMFLKQTGTDKDATIRFTLQALRVSLQNNQNEKAGEP